MIQANLVNLRRAYW